MTSLIESISRKTAKPPAFAAGVLLFALAVALLGFGVPLVHWGLTPGYDWDLFSGYSLVLRTNLLHYLQLPLQDPLSCGGIDLLANPQTRMFSPMVLVDALFPPFTANFVSLLVYAFVGALGMIRLLRDRGRSEGASLAGAAMFINSSWFGLHFSEGHITYGSMQLLPWVLYLGLRLRSSISVFALISLLTLFVLDGAIYTAIYGALLLVGGAAAGLIPVRPLFQGGRRHGVLVGLATLAGLLLISVKALPILLLTAKIHPYLDFTNLNLPDLGRAFFDPRQRHLDVASTDSTWRFHEFGCYLSPLGLGLILLKFRPAARRSAEFVPALLLMLFFFWLGSGWGAGFNPWNLYQRIPLLNTAHVQSRLFVLMHFFFVLLAAEGLDDLPRGGPRLRTALAVLLVLEAGFVKTYPFRFAYRFAKPIPAGDFIPDVPVLGVRDWGPKPELYLHPTHVVRLAYEAAAPETRVRSEGDPDYRGMAWVDSGLGRVGLEHLRPSRIELSFAATTRLRVGINANFLGGWIVEKGSSPATVSASGDGRITLDIETGEGRIALIYRPDYLRPVLLAFSAGLLLWCGLATFLWRRRSECGAE